MSGVVKSAVYIHPMNLDHYQHYGIYAKLNQIPGVNNTLHDIDEAHYGTLDRSPRKHNYDYARSTIIMYFLSTFNPERATCATAMQTVGDTKMLKDGYCIVILDCRHRHFSVRMLPNEDYVEWV